MTVELLEQGAGDVEKLLVAWLAPLRRTAITRKAGDVLPFTLVRHITGGERSDEMSADPVVSVHTLCSRAGGEAAAAAEADETHRRMLRLAQYLDAITIGDTAYSIDYMQVVESPIWVPYDDEQILRKVGRYRIGLTYITRP